MSAVGIAALVRAFALDLIDLCDEAEDLNALFVYVNSDDGGYYDITGFKGDDIAFSETEVIDEGQA